MLTCNGIVNCKIHPINDISGFYIDSKANHLFTNRAKVQNRFFYLSVLTGTESQLIHALSDDLLT